HLFWTYGFELTQPWGASMLPTLHMSGEWVVVSKYYRRGRGVQVGDMVCSRSPIRPTEGILKRVLGMPGDLVIAGDVQTGSGEMIQVPAGHCFLSGDNQEYSRDSRHYGPVPLALIRGKVVARVLPWRNACVFENPMQPVRDE
ncbi:LexA/Signal peptidase, partial [Trichodelitschia bisporula]